MEINWARELWSAWRAMLPKYLDEDMLDTPAVALEAARSEIKRLGKRVRKMVRDPDWQANMRAKPLKERLRIAQEARRQSLEQTINMSLDIMDVNQQAVDDAHGELSGVLPIGIARIPVRR